MVEGPKPRGQNYFKNQTFLNPSKLTTSNMVGDTSNRADKQMSDRVNMEENRLSCWATM